MAPNRAPQAAPDAHAAAPLNGHSEQITHLIEKTQTLEKRVRAAHEARRAKEEQLNAVRDAADAVLDELHNLHRRGPGQLRTPLGMVDADDVCTACHTAWPCDTGRILTRQEPRP